MTLASPAPSYQSATVIDAWDESPSLRALRLELDPQVRPLHKAPGQFIKARAASGEGFFALSSAPDSGRTELLVKRGAPLADALIDAGRAGVAIEATAPMGSGFPVDEMVDRDVLLFAAGSGIAPIRALVQHILRVRGQVGRVTLFYGHRSQSDFAYLREHTEWEGHGVRVVLCCSDPAPGWEGARGRVQDVARARGLDGISPIGAVAYICGMKGMVAGVREVLADEGIPAQRTFLNF